MDFTIGTYSIILLAEQW